MHIYNISNILRAANASGTFFFNGNNRACIYSPESMNRVKYAYSQGHQIASHTWSHKDLTTLTWDQIHDEMWRVEQAFQRIIGVKPAFMRPPYGSYNDLVRAASFIRGQKVVLWDFDARDTLGATVEETKALYDQVAVSHPSSLLAVNHETVETTAYEVLPYAIDKLQKAGYRLVTLGTCMGLSRYQSVGPPGVPDASWRC